MASRMIFLVVLQLILSVTSTTNRLSTLNIPNLNQYPVKQIVYQKFQTNVDFELRTISSVFVKVPGLSIVLAHTQPMLYELQIEAVCRVAGSGNAVEINFLYDDYVLDQTTLVKNGDQKLSSVIDYWYSPQYATFHFACFRSQTIYLNPGTHLIEVGVRARQYSPNFDILHGKLTIKLSQYIWDQFPVGSLNMSTV